MSAIIRFWLVRETDLARQYSKTPELAPAFEDLIWIPKSIIEHTTKRGNEHQVKLPDWFIEKKGL
jgi:hypothetical protein